MSRLYEDAYHRTVAEVDFGIYNWKRHSTGYLIKELRQLILTRSLNFNPYANVKYWEAQWELRLRDELAKRPHVSNKRERKTKNS